MFDNATYNKHYISLDNTVCNYIFLYITLHDTNDDYRNIPEINYIYIRDNDDYTAKIDDNIISHGFPFHLFVLSRDSGRCDESRWTVP